MTASPAFLAPEVHDSTLVEKAWGGRRLGPLRGGPAYAGRAVGESWEFSTLPARESSVGGSPLSRVLGGPLSFLAKLLDTADALSVQVHPEDDPDTAAAGKEEAWVVLDAEHDAHVWAGVREDIDPARFEAHVREASEDPTRGGSVLDDLQRIPVATGTCILVPAGTVHAIGPGILLAEIQQPTDRTHRLFDHGRPRPLHVDEGLAAYRVTARPTVWRPDDGKPGTLVGKHVRLDVVRAGSVDRRAPTEPVLVVPVLGTVVAEAADGTAETLDPGALRLWVGAGSLTVADDGLAVLGVVR